VPSGLGGFKSVLAKMPFLQGLLRLKRLLDGDTLMLSAGAVLCGSDVLQECGRDSHLKRHDGGLRRSKYPILG